MSWRYFIGKLVKKPLRVSVIYQLYWTDNERPFHKQSEYIFNSEAEFESYYRAFNRVNKTTKILPDYQIKKVY